MSTVWIIVLAQAVLLILFGFVLSNVVARLIALERGLSTTRAQPWFDVVGRRLPPDVVERMGTDDALVLFVSTDCGTCRALLNSVAREGTADTISVPMFVAGRDELSLPSASMIPLDDAGHTFDALDVPVTPFVVAVRNGSVVHASTATTSDDLTAAGAVLASDRRKV